MFSEVAAFGVDVVGGGEESETEHKAGVTKGRNPNRAHPGGYSRGDATSWRTSYGWDSQPLDRVGVELGVIHVKVVSS